MSGLLLYSTNPYLKFHIQESYRKHKHYVWCAAQFDSTKANAYATAVQTPPSSDPCGINKDLKAAVDRGDQHCAKIISQRQSLIKLAAGWEKRGEISLTQKQDIIYQAKNADLKDWRPLIYIIPRKDVETRLKLVPASKRAGLADEWILEETLDRTEFDIVEL